MYKKIMVPLDGSELAECVIPHVTAFIDQCQELGALLILLADRGSGVAAHRCHLRPAQCTARGCRGSRRGRCGGAFPAESA